MLDNDGLNALDDERQTRLGTALDKVRAHQLGYRNMTLLREGDYGIQDLRQNVTGERRARGAISQCGSEPWVR